MNLRSLLANLRLFALVSRAGTLHLSTNAVILRAGTLALHAGTVVLRAGTRAGKTMTRTKRANFFSLRLIFPCIDEFFPVNGELLSWKNRIR
jgi:hypothetical protein